VAIIDYARDNKIDDDVEVVGLCCTAHDITRYHNRGRIVGPISWQLRFLRSGLADVVVLDEQCVRTDVADEATRARAPVIAASEKKLHGLQESHERPRR